MAVYFAAALVEKLVSDGNDPVIADRRSGSFQQNVALRREQAHTAVNCPRPGKQLRVSDVHRIYLVAVKLVSPDGQMIVADLYVYVVSFARKLPVQQKLAARFAQSFGLAVVRNRKWTVALFVLVAGNALNRLRMFLGSLNSWWSFLLVLSNPRS